MYSLCNAKVQKIQDGVMQLGTEGPLEWKINLEIMLIVSKYADIPVVSAGGNESEIDVVLDDVRSEGYGFGTQSHTLLFYTPLLLTN